MTDHTPGPWTFEGGEWVLGPNGERIAQVYNWKQGYLENGQILAAAPDLLAALRAVSAEAWRMYIAHEEQEIPTERDLEIERALARAHDAIARATG